VAKEVTWGDSFAEKVHAGFTFCHPSHSRYFGEFLEATVETREAGNNQQRRRIEKDPSNRLFTLQY
jgi:hypothetical protein